MSEITGSGQVKAQARLIVISRLLSYVQNRETNRRIVYLANYLVSNKYVQCLYSRKSFE